MYFVYILECNDKTYYTGITTDLVERLKSHNSGKGAKYTRVRLPVRILESWKVENRSEASKVEYYIKKQKREKKKKYIRNRNLLIEEMKVVLVDIL